MILIRVVVTGFALWLASEVVSGVRLARGLDPLARVGTLLVIALLLAVVDMLSTSLRRALALVVEPLPIAVTAAVALNAALFWATVALADAAGLGFSVTGFLPALVGSIVVLMVTWLVTPAPSIRG